MRGTVLLKKIERRHSKALQTLLIFLNDGVTECMFNHVKFCNDKTNSEAVMCDAETNRSVDVTSC